MTTWRFSFRLSLIPPPVFSLFPEMRVLFDNLSFSPRKLENHIKGGRRHKTDGENVKFSFHFLLLFFVILQRRRFNFRMNPVFNIFAEIIAEFLKFSVSALLRIIEFFCVKIRNNIINSVCFKKTYNFFNKRFKAI